MQVNTLTLQRLSKQQKAIESDPIPNALVCRQDNLKWYFCLYNLNGPYSGGWYFGLLQLSENYPIAAPKLYFYTHSGRFDVNIPICTSFTNSHKDGWSPAWSVRTLIQETIRFMYIEEEAFGSCRASYGERQRMARQSLDFNLKNPTFVRLFNQKRIKLNQIDESLALKKVPVVLYVPPQQREREDRAGLELREELREELDEPNVLLSQQEKDRRINILIKGAVFVGAVTGLTVLVVKYL